MYKGVIAVVLACLMILFSSFKITKNIRVEGENYQGIPWPYTICGDNAAWKIQSLTLGSTPKRNANNDIDVAGTTDRPVTFVRADINVTLNGVFLDKQVAEFTESYDAGDAVDFAYKNYIPSFAPPGNYGLTFSFIDSKQQQNGCLQFQFKL